jgi:hypothetical protein
MDLRLPNAATRASAMAPGPLKKSVRLPAQLFAPHHARGRVGVFSVDEGCAWPPC